MPAKKKNSITNLNTNVLTDFFENYNNIQIEDDKEEKEISKSPFDYSNAINKGNESFWKTLTKNDIKTFNTYMVNRALSQNPEYIGIINELQQYTIGLPLPVECTLRLYREFLPSINKYRKYIKSNKKEYDEKIISILIRKYDISSIDAEMYLEIYLNTDNGIKNLIEILQDYGLDEKSIKKILGDKYEINK